MNAAAKGRCPWASGSACWRGSGWPTCGSGLRACWSGSSKRCGCERAPYGGDRGGFRAALCGAAAAERDVSVEVRAALKCQKCRPQGRQRWVPTFRPVLYDLLRPHAAASPSNSL